jgi:putative membrane protein
MKKIFVKNGILSLILFVMAGCTATTNTNTSNSNAGRSMSNTTLGNAANSVGNAANSVSNTISNTVKSVTGTSDSSFVEEAATGGMSEVELGKLASTKAASPDVKKFGQMMVTDHSKANDELKALAKKKNWTLPTDLDSSSKSTLDSLKNKTGADFDKEYVSEMVDDHEKDVKAFQDKAENATDPDLKAFAAKTLPTLQKHLDAIKAIQAKMK